MSIFFCLFFKNSNFLLNTIVIHPYKEIFLPEYMVKENAEIQMIWGDLFYFPYKRHYVVLNLGCRVYIVYIMINSTTLLFNGTQSAIGAIGWGQLLICN